MQTQVIESGVQLFSRLSHSSFNFCLSDINPKLFQQGAPHPKDTIEIAGDFSKDLLLDFIIRCVLPKDLNPEWKGSGVVFVNTTHHISILRITTVISAHLKHLNVTNRKPIIEKALSYITLLNCYSGDQIDMTLRNLERVIQDRANVNLLVIDDIISQFWIAQQSVPKVSLQQLSKNNFQILQNIAKNLNLVLIFSRYQLGDLKKNVDLHVDYKIIGEKLESKNHFIVIDYVKKISNSVPFILESFINFI